jgi:hypothetical protein
MHRVNKGKVVHMSIIKSQREIRGIAPLILNLGNRHAALLTEKETLAPIE